MSMLPPPSTLEGAPDLHEYDGIRYAGHAPAPQLWDPPAMGSFRGLRGRSSRRDLSRLLGDYQRRQVGAGFVPGLEVPPPNTKRTWSMGEIRAPSPAYDPLSVWRDGVYRLFAGDLSQEALRRV